MDQVCIEDVIGFTLLWEGGFVNMAEDPGGATYQGVTQKTYNTYRKNNNEGPRNILLLTEHERTDIYTSMYWDPCMCSEMSYPLALVVFDCAVNCGVKQSIRFLQRALKCTVDGIMGPNTLDCVRKHPDQRMLSIDLIGIREQFYLDLIAKKPSMSVFKRGWLNRTAALKQSI